MHWSHIFYLIYWRGCGEKDEDKCGNVIFDCGNLLDACMDTGHSFKELMKGDYVRVMGRKARYGWGEDLE